MAIDPVCGMEVGTEANTHKATYQGVEYHFCSLDCKDEFQAEPEDYVERRKTLAFRRSKEFTTEVRNLIEALESDAVVSSERMRIAEILRKNTSDNECLVNARDDEPIFVIRAKDPIGADTVNYWVNRSNVADLHADKRKSAAQVSADMDLWRIRQKS